MIRLLNLDAAVAHVLETSRFPDRSPQREELTV